MEYFFKFSFTCKLSALFFFFLFLIILHFAFAQCCHHHKFVSHLCWAPSFLFFFSFSAVCASIDCGFILLSYRAQTGFNQGLLLFHRHGIKKVEVMWYLSFRFLFEFSLCLPRLLCYSLSSLTCSLSFSLCTLLFFLSLSSLLFVWESSLKLPPSWLAGCLLSWWKAMCLSCPMGFSKPAHCF